MTCREGHPGSRVGRSWAVTLLVLCVACQAPSARAQHLSAGEPLTFVRSARLTTPGVLVASVTGHYFESYDLSACLDTGSGDYASVCLAADYGVAPWLSLGLDIPVRRASWEVSGEVVETTGLDNPVVGARLAVPTPFSFLALAVDARVGLPVDGKLSVADTSGATCFLGGGNRPDAEMALLATADFSDTAPLRLHLNAGWAFHRSESTGRRFHPASYPPSSGSGGASANDAVILRAAVVFPGRAVDLFTEFRGDMLRDRGLVALKENPLTITPGVRVHLGDALALTAAMSVAVSGNDRNTPEFDPHNAYPDWEATVRLSYGWPVSVADTDSDGVPDFRDRCPRLPEDHDGYDDGDGCPDRDNDNDGVPDIDDGAPLLPEDVDGFEDNDGVPDLDNDGDGIVDERDMCPDEPEDLNGFEDEDGCPDR